MKNGNIKEELSEGVIIAFSFVTILLLIFFLWLPVSVLWEKWSSVWWPEESQEEPMAGNDSIILVQQVVSERAQKFAIAIENGNCVWFSEVNGINP
jgi:hypothetical protein